MRGLAKECSNAAVACICKEVKGSGDRLQDNQVRWLDYYAKHDMPVAVCYVQWAKEAE